ncbi:hypothetical protein FRC18_005051 [Serendipita sp. 400]|nr:hypothetical protein FRC18_005051 [Serendipita sp. 400]
MDSSTKYEVSLVDMDDKVDTGSSQPPELSEKGVTPPRSTDVQQKLPLPSRPWALNHHILTAISCSLVGIGVGIIVTWYAVNIQYQGLLPFSDSSYIHYAWTIPPAFASTAITFVLSSVSFKVQRLAPWYAMADERSNGVPGSQSIFVDYLDCLPHNVLRKSFKNGHRMVLMW